MKRFGQHASLVVVGLFLFVALAFAQNAISRGTVLEGFVLDKKNTNFPMVINIVSMDNVTGTFTGDLSWPSLNSIHRIEGRLAGNTMTFKEVSHIKRGGAHLNCEYALVMEGKSLEGRWVEPGRDRGPIQLKIK